MVVTFELGNTDLGEEGVHTSVTPIFAVSQVRAHHRMVNRAQSGQSEMDVPLAIARLRSGPIRRPPLPGGENKVGASLDGRALACWSNTCLGKRG